MTQQEKPMRVSGAQARPEVLSSMVSRANPESQFTARRRHSGMIDLACICGLWKGGIFARMRRLATCFSLPAYVSWTRNFA